MSSTLRTVCVKPVYSLTRLAKTVVSHTLPLYLKATPVPFRKSGQTLIFVAVISCHQVWLKYVHGFVVSKETVVLRRWERSKQKFGFIKRVDKG